MSDLTDEERDALYHTTDYRDGDDSWAELLPLVERIVARVRAAERQRLDDDGRWDDDGGRHTGKAQT